MKKRGKGWRATYPWEKWFEKKRPFKLVKGKDFHCQMHGMSNQIRNQASKRGYSVSLIIQDPAIEVTVIHE